MRALRAHLEGGAVESVGPELEAARAHEPYPGAPCVVRKLTDAQRERFAALGYICRCGNCELARRAR